MSEESKLSELQYARECLGTINATIGLLYKYKDINSIKHVLDTLEGMKVAYFNIIRQGEL